MRTSGTRGRRHRLVAAVLVSVLALLAAGPATTASAQTYVPISGAGSTWSQNALEQWIRNVGQYGMKVNYAGTGSSDGRNQFRNGTVDFAVSEIPYGLRDAGVVDTPPQREFAYMPIVAGGTAFMYNLKVGDARVTNLRLSGETLAKIFTGVITLWSDPAIQADNPGLTLPARRVVPVVRSDGSGTTAQLTTWLSKEHTGLWDAYCGKAGRSTPCGVTSNYPTVPGSGFVAQSGSLGVSSYVKQAQSEGAITYVEYSYALNSEFPVAKVLNGAGYYTEPTAQNVAVGLLGASINTNEGSDEYLTQDLTGVYRNGDPRAYPLSSYSYMILPTTSTGTFTDAKGGTLADFAYYFLCEGQQQADVLGYSPLPINLVQAGLEQIRRIPGADVQNVDISKCNNPTFSGDGTNTLAANAPQPPECDKAGPSQCGSPTGGAQTATPVTGGKAATSGGGKKSSAGGATGNGSAASGSGGSESGGGSGTGGATTGGAPTGGATTVVDPDTGEVVTTDGGGATPVLGGTDGATPGTAVAVGAVPVAGVPVSTVASVWDGDRTLMVLTGALLVLLVLGPPLLARGLRNRTTRSPR